jgi:hypothetical protein
MAIIYRLLQNKPLAQEDIDRLVVAYEETLNVLNMKDLNESPVAEVIAKKIIEIGQTGVRNPLEISKLALIEFLSAPSAEGHGS